MNIRKSVSKSARNKYFIGAQRWRKRTFIFLPFIAVEEKCFGYFFFCEGSEALVLWFGFSLHVFRTDLDGWGQKQRLMWSFALYCVFLRLVLKIVEVVCFTRLVSCFETVSK